MGHLKNQVGTFYSANSICIVKELLEGLQNKQLQSAYGELVKMAFINGGDFARELFSLDIVDKDMLWKFLPEAIQAQIQNC